jgi:hypothetical protein
MVLTTQQQLLQARLHKHHLMAMSDKANTNVNNMAIVTQRKRLLSK